MGYAIAFVGPSQSGKTMLMNAVLAELAGRATVIRSVTTRPKRDSEDDAYYEFVTRDEFQRRIVHDAFAHYVEHAGNFYGTQRQDIDRVVMGRQFGLGAFVEQGVLNLRRNNYRPFVIKVIPQHYQPSASELRRMEDAARDRIDLGPDMVVENSFLPGGREVTVARVLDFLASLQS